MLVTKLLQNGLTDSQEILWAYWLGLRIGQHLFFIRLRDKKNGKTMFAGTASYLYINHIYIFNLLV